MKVCICDDEEEILSMTLAYIKNLYPFCEVKGYLTGSELLDALQIEHYDVLLLDIDMPMMSGLEIASAIKQFVHQPLLVFVTSHDELVYDSLRYHPFGFVRKTYFKDEIEKVLSDCVSDLQQRKRHFNITVDGKTICLKLSEIEYFESEGNYLLAYTQENVYRFRQTLTSVQESLEVYGFIRVHKGFLINQEAVKIMGATQVHLNSGVVVPMGKNYMETSKKMLMRYMRL